MPLALSSTGSDDEQHLAGYSAIIRSSWGNRYVNPSALTFREAVFWVYVRQCLYNATINQQPPDIDFSLQLHPTPGETRDAHPLARLRLETAWANQMTWNVACVVNFCFDGENSQNEKAHKMRRWQELCDLLQTWMHERPDTFDPIFEDLASHQGSFPRILFTADWHSKYCILTSSLGCLKTYQPYRSGFTTLRILCCYVINQARSLGSAMLEPFLIQRQGIKPLESTTMYSLQ